MTMLLPHDGYADFWPFISAPLARRLLTFAALTRGAVMGASSRAVTSGRVRQGDAETAAVLCVGFAPLGDALAGFHFAPRGRGRSQPTRRRYRAHYAAFSFRRIALIFLAGVARVVKERATIPPPRLPVTDLAALERLAGCR